MIEIITKGVKMELILEKKLNFSQLKITYEYGEKTKALKKQIISEMGYVPDYYLPFILVNNNEDINECFVKKEDQTIDAFIQERMLTEEEANFVLDSFVDQIISGKYFDNSGFEFILRQNKIKNTK